MQLAYDHTSVNKFGKTLSGTVYSESRDMAWVMLSKKMGLKPIIVKLNLGLTLQNLFSQDFDKKELAKFYTSIGKRIKSGRTLVDGLDHAQEFVLDSKLRQAISIMKQSIVEGNDEYVSMKMAGFPERDAYAIRSTSIAGRSSETFISLAADINRSADLRKKVNQVLFMPVMMLILIYVAFYFLTIYASPKLSKFLKVIEQTSMGGGMPKFAQYYYHFVDLFNMHIWISSSLYAIIPLLVIIFIRTSYFKKLINRITIIKTIAERSEMSSLWMSFAMLYEAAINLETACSMLSKAARREEAAIWFRAMGTYIRAGMPIEAAVSRSGFPSYVARGIRAAESSGDMVGGIVDFSNDIAMDVEMLTGRLQDYIQIGSLLVMATIVFGFFMVSYYPILSSILKQF